MIYFVSNENRIKVGTTRGDVADRIKQIGAHLTTPLILIGTIDGGHALERAIHSHLDQYRLQGEWFRDCEEVRRCVRGLILGGGEAIGFKPLFESIPLPARDIDPEARGNRRRCLFRVLANHAFPVATADEIRRLTKNQYGERTVYDWLAGNTEPPMSVFILVLNEIFSLD